MDECGLIWINIYCPMVANHDEHLDQYRLIMNMDRCG